MDNIVRLMLKGLAMAHVDMAPRHKLRKLLYIKPYLFVVVIVSVVGK